MSVSSPAERVMRTLMYEGYVLYPYRADALKNQFRWQYGIVAPAGGDEPSHIETQVLILPPSDAPLDVHVKVGFLHLERRDLERAGTDGTWESVDALEVGERVLTRWTEATPVLLDVGRVLGSGAMTERFTREIAGSASEEIIRDDDDRVVGRVLRRREPVACAITANVDVCGGYRKLTVRVEHLGAGAWGDRERLLAHALISVHVLLRVQQSEFVSLLDPPPAAAAAAALCRNARLWPVLIGAPGSRDTVLCSPIVLYDYPALAPESPGDWCDATEIDELLGLRVQTLTDEERRRARATDPLAREILDRAAQLPMHEAARLHGAVRSLASESDSGAGDGAFLLPTGDVVARGSRVRLTPKHRADAMDVCLAGASATVSGIHHDLDGNTHIAVILDDGAADLHEQVGRFLYFHPDEIHVEHAGGGAAPTERGVLVAGIGNLFLGDDGFGPAVIQRLAARVLPPHVHVEDYGIRGLHLAHDLTSGRYERAILIDAMSRGAEPGTVYAIIPDVSDAARDVAPIVDAHTMTVDAVFRFASDLGGRCPEILIVGCEPASLEPEIGLSEPVCASVEVAADRVVQLIGNRVA